MEGGPRWVAERTGTGCPALHHRVGVRDDDTELSSIVVLARHLVTATSIHIAATGGVPTATSIHIARLTRITCAPDANHLWTAFGPTNVAFDVARAYSVIGRRDDALYTVLDAERMAPEQVRHHHLSRKIVLNLVQRSVGKPSVELGKLAQRVTVLAG
jgi:hypothetical protein